MDVEVVSALRGAGIETDDLAALRVEVERGPDGRVLPLGDEITVRDAEGRGARVTLRTASALCEGARSAPDLRGEPPAEYRAVIELIERTVAAYAAASGTRIYDEQAERVFAEIARRPDGRPAGPLASYARAAARLALALRSLSAAEYEAVARRLAHSARTFRTHATSTNYHVTVLTGMLGEA